MIIHEGYENFDLANPVVTLGIFDGVHRGHQMLLNCLVSKAEEIKGESVVITFSPHPRIVIDKDNANLSFLNTMEEKMVLLERSNIDHLVIIEFSKEFSMIEACDFVKDVLVAKIRAKHLLIGFNHHFGRSGKGDYNTIRECTETIDFKVEQVQGLQTEEGAISSSLIREALLTGRLDDANRWLGYPYSISGTIIEGRKIGRTIGFPTANIEPDDKYKLVPGNGVYAVEVLLDNRYHPGMLSIGTNPTINPDIRMKSIEVNILDFNRNIYGNAISVIFRKRLREEIKFNNMEELARQMDIDRRNVMQLLA